MINSNEAIPHVLVVGTPIKYCKVIHDQGCLITYLIASADIRAPHLTAGFFNIVCLPKDYGEHDIQSLVEGINKSRKIDHVVSLHDRYQPVARSAARCLGKDFPNASALELTADKVAMRQVLAEKGLEHIPFASLNSYSCLEKIGSVVPYPCIIKPLGGSGSRNIFRLQRPEDLEHFQQVVSKEEMQEGYIAEAFLTGDEYSVECLSEQGQHRVIAVTQKFKDEETFIEFGHCVPAPIADESRRQYADYVAKILGALGVTDGPTHTEIIVTPDGPRIVETHTRCGGDNITDLVQEATGVDLVTLSARQALGLKVLDSIPLEVTRKKYAAVSYLKPEKVGKLIRDPDLGNATTSPNIHKVECQFSKGQSLREVKHSFDRPAYAIALHEDAVTAVSSAQAALTCIQFDFE